MTKECSQCGKPAVGEGGGQPLCLQCLAQLEEIVSRERRDRLEYGRHLAAMINYNQQRMLWSVGLSTSLPQLEVPAPAPHYYGGPVTVTNLDIDGGTIGLLNVGEIKDVASISVRISELEGAGHGEVAAAFKAVTEALVKATEVPSETKTELLEQLAELAQQASVLPSESVKPGVIRALLASARDGLSALGSVAEVWATWGPSIERFFDTMMRGG